MNWRTAITSSGLEILTGLGNNQVAIVSAFSGSGLVPDELLEEQTALVNPKQTLAIIEDRRVENRRILRLQLSNNTLLSGYTLNQLGIFVSVDGGAPELYFIAQNEIGETIPSCDSVNGFLAEYIVTLNFSSNSNVAVESSEVGFITADALDARIEGIREEIEIIVSPTEPLNWFDGQWWYEEIGDIDLGADLLGIEIISIPFDETKEFHIDIEGDYETLINASGVESSALADDLIFV